MRRRPTTSRATCTRQALEKRLAVALAALGATDAAFFASVTLACDALAGTSLPLRVAVYVASALVLLARLAAFFRYWRTAALYRAARTAGPGGVGLPPPVSIVNGRAAAVQYSALATVLALAAPPPQPALLGAWALALAANETYARLADDVPSLRRYVAEHVLARRTHALEQAADPVRVVWAAGRGGGAAAAPRRRGEEAGEDSWSSIELSEAQRRMPSAPPATAQTTSSSETETFDSDDDEDDGDRYSGDTEILFDGSDGESRHAKLFNAIKRH